MALSVEQKAALLAGRQELLARFGELLQERRAMQARLRAYTLAMLVRAHVWPRVRTGRACTDGHWCIVCIALRPLLSIIRQVCSDASPSRMCGALVHHPGAPLAVAVLLLCCTACGCGVAQTKTLWEELRQLWG